MIIIVTSFVWCDFNSDQKKMKINPQIFKDKYTVKSVIPDSP